MYADDSVSIPGKSRDFSLCHSIYTSDVQTFLIVGRSDTSDVAKCHKGLLFWALKKKG
jgi:hypothetical protein